MLQWLSHRGGRVELEFAPGPGSLDSIRVNNQSLYFAAPSSERHHAILGCEAPDAAHAGPVEILALASQDFARYPQDAFMLSGGAAWADSGDPLLPKKLVLPGPGARAEVGLGGRALAILVHQRAGSASLKVDLDGRETRTFELALPIRAGEVHRKSLHLELPAGGLAQKYEIGVPGSIVTSIGIDPRNKAAWSALRKVTFSGLIPWSVEVASPPGSGCIRAPWWVRLALGACAALPALAAGLLFWKRRGWAAITERLRRAGGKAARWGLAAIILGAALGLQAMIFGIPFVERVSVGRHDLYAGAVTGTADISLGSGRLGQRVRLPAGKLKIRKLQFAIEAIGKGSCCVHVVFHQGEPHGLEVGRRDLWIRGRPGPQLLEVDLAGLPEQQDLYADIQVEAATNPADRVCFFQTTPSEPGEAYGEFAVKSEGSSVARWVYEPGYAMAHELLSGAITPVFYPGQKRLLLVSVILLNLALIGALALWVAGSRRAAAVVGILCFAVALANMAHYLFLCDDAFISFRYAKNFVHGLGLVFNTGERVEGYTNFLWVLVMSAVLKAGGSILVAAPILTFLSSLALLALAYFLARRVFGLGTYPALACVLVLAASRQFGVWSSSGLETRIFSALVLAAWYFLLAGDDSNHSRFWLPLSAVFFVLAALTRPEGMLFAGLAGAGLILRRPLPRPRALALWFAIVIAGIGGHLLWRKAYYGAWVPNTFFAKMAYLPDPGIGLTFFMYFTAEYGPLIVAPLVLLPGLLAAGEHRRREKAFLLASVILYIGWIIENGGDLFEFRAFDVVFAPLIVMAAAAILKLPRRVAWCAGVPALAWFLVIPHATNLPFSAATPDEPLAARTTWTQEKLPVLGWVTDLHALWYRESTGRAAGHRAEHLNEFCRGVYEYARKFAPFVQQGYLAREDAFALNAAGIVPYFLDVNIFDNLGLNESYVARLPRIRRMVTAHEKNALKTAQAYVIRRNVMPFILIRPWPERVPPEAIGEMEELVKSVDPSQNYWFIKMRRGDESLVLTSFEPERIREIEARCRRLKAEYKVFDRWQLTSLPTP